MDGVHDCGGKQGFGRVDRAGGDRNFHGRWEAAVFAMVQAAAEAGALICTDRFRHAIERVDPRAYLTQGYYGRWLGGIETLLVEAGVVSQQEITRRALSLGASQDDLVAARPLREPDPRGPMPAAPGSDREISDRQPRFRPGDTVRTMDHGFDGHTRLPAYARGRQGRVTACHDGWVYPDSNAHGQGEAPQYLYTVRFSSVELWGRGGFSVSLDLFEPYLLMEDRQ